MAKGGGRQILHACPDQPPKFHPSCTVVIGYLVSFAGVMQLGCGVYDPPPSSTKVKERVELYLYIINTVQFIPILINGHSNIILSLPRHFFLILNRIQN
jgi:hypothetical protein